MKPEDQDAMRRRVRDTVVLLEHKEGSRMVDVREIGTLVRVLGVNPTGVQVAGLVEQLNGMVNEGDVLMPLSYVEQVVTAFMVAQEAALFRDDYHTLLRAFRAFDPDGKGFIMAEQLKAALGTKGEALSEDEANKMLAFAADDDGKIFYEDYAAKMAKDGRSI
uniref:EF-hand domain-containing protein n=1 Tax=Chlamydomonas euryale TaxID=1486919 RepID=A0A7R9VK45_9CHLO|mmetsp:Transcript_37875/g.112123  ORF Transcript_37875/g.112123 Transcript_37875/m.112123 type:complete len:163 (+) Transcript_37875:252-740(+)